jgi:DHA1 family tetracycline resistance protein-like MFS transporter
MGQKKTRKDLIIIVITAFLNFLGMTLVFPIFTPLCLDSSEGLLPNGASHHFRTTMLGILLGLYPLIQFFTAPLFGSLSDRIGRKKVLIISGIGFLIGNLLMGLSILLHNLPLALISRIAMGGLSGSLSVTQSSISDLSTDKTKTSNFALLGVAFGLGLFIGPALGGIFSDSTINPHFSYDTPFWIASVLSLINIFQIVISFTETLSENKRRFIKINVFSGLNNFSKAMMKSSWRHLFLVVFFYGFGFNFFTQFFQVYLVTRFNASTSETGLVYSFIGLLSIITQGLLIRPINKKFSPNQILRVTLILCSLSFPVVLSVYDFRLLFIALFIVPVLNGLSFPNMTTSVSKLADEKSQGEILGVNQSVQAVAQFLPPLIGGYLVAFHYTLPLWIASGMIFLSWLIYLTIPKSAAIANQQPAVSSDNSK